MTAPQSTRGRQWLWVLNPDLDLDLGSVHAVCRMVVLVEWHLATRQAGELARRARARRRWWRWVR